MHHLQASVCVRRCRNRDQEEERKEKPHAPAEQSVPVRRPNVMMFCEVVIKVSLESECEEELTWWK